MSDNGLLRSDAASSNPGPALASAGRGRACWSGLLNLGLVAIPVQAYPATRSAPDLPGHQLHADCGRRIRYEKRCPVHGPVEAGAIVKGYEDMPGQFVVLDEGDLEALRPARDRALALDNFLDLDTLDPALFAGRTLYLMPDGPAAHQAYLVLAQALRHQRKGALGRLWLGGRRQLALVRPAARLLMLHLLFYPAQLRGPAALEADLRSVPIGTAESQLAKALLEAYSQPVRWTDYRDDSAEQLAALVAAKRHGQPLAATVRPEPAVGSLLEALRQSVAALSGSPPPADSAETSPHPKRNPKRRT